MKQKKLKIVYKKISEIIPYANNARVHDQDQIDQIKNSILEFGMNTTISIRKNVIVYGHGRIEALLQLGETEAPTVDLSHLTEAQTKAYILADNKIALNAGYDPELIKLELSILDDLDFDLSLTGFDEDELKLYLGNAEGVDFPTLNSGEKEPFQQIAFSLHDDQADVVKDALDKAKENDLDYELNTNINANALHYICSYYLRESE